MGGDTMRTAYFLNGVEVSKPTMVKIGLHRCIINPTHEHLIEAGYEIREVEIPRTEIEEIEENTPVEEVHVKTYDERVSELIRFKYSPDQEYAILRQRDRKPEEFEEYDNYCENCKTVARTEFGIEQPEIEIDKSVEEVN